MSVVLSIRGPEEAVVELVDGESGGEFDVGEGDVVVVGDVPGLFTELLEEVRVAVVAAIVVVDCVWFPGAPSSWTGPMKRLTGVVIA